MEAPQVEIMLEKLIKPSSQTPNHFRVYNLSFLDRLSLPLYTPIIYSYPFNKAMEHAETTRIIGQLEKSLSQILSIYYPVAGRIASPDLLTVNCDDQGVLFSVKNVKTTMNDFVEKMDNDASIVDCLVPQLVVEGELVHAPLVKVQVSVFECSSLTIAVCFMHTLGDGFTYTKFFADWAKLMNQSVGGELTVSFDKEAFFSSQIEKLSEKANLNYPKREVKMKKIVGRRIVFDGFTVKRLKDKVMSCGKWNFERPPSKVEVLTAVVLNGLICASQERNGSQRPFMTSLSMNIRGKFFVSNNCFGNCYIPVPIKIFPSVDVKTWELYDFVFLIRNSLQETQSELSKASKEDIYHMINRAISEMKAWFANKDEVDVVFGSSICTFPLYDVDFGWGNPNRVFVPTLKGPGFFLMDSKFGHGVELFLSLEEPDMESSLAHIMHGMEVSTGEQNSSTSRTNEGNTR